jgi:hypothetical protein
VKTKLLRVNTPKTNFYSLIDLIFLIQILENNAFTFKLIISISFFIRVGKKPGKFQKTHGNGKNWFLPGKMGKTGKTVFFLK